MKTHLPILIVENNKKEAELLKGILENEGFLIDTVFSGEAALEMFKNRKYASAILDFALPDMKGDEVAKIIKFNNPKMRIILLTGFRSAIDPKRLECFMYVFDKPIDPRNIIKSLVEITSNLE